MTKFVIVPQATLGTQYRFATMISFRGRLSYQNVFPTNSSRNTILLRECIADDRIVPKMFVKRQRFMSLWKRLSEYLWDNVSRTMMSFIANVLSAEQQTSSELIVNKINVIIRIHENLCKRKYKNLSKSQCPQNKVNKKVSLSK